MGLFGTPTNKGRTTRATGTFKRCSTCRGTGRARGMGATGAKCAGCRGMGQRKVA